MQRYSTILPPLFALVFVGTLFSLFWGYSAAKEGPLGKIQSGFPKPDNPEYATFYHNYQVFYGEGNGKEGRRERLRQIQKQLEMDQESLVLKKELAAYHAWIKTVPEKRNEINRTETIEDRLVMIHSIKEEQSRIQGDSERKTPKSNSGTMNLFPSIYELAEYLEYLEVFNATRLEELLGYTPSNFLSQLEIDYRGEME